MAMGHSEEPIPPVILLAGPLLGERARAAQGHPGMSAGVERRPAATRLGRWWQSWT